MGKCASALVDWPNWRTNQMGKTTAKEMSNPNGQLLQLLKLCPAISKKFFGISINVKCCIKRADKGLKEGGIRARTRVECNMII